MAKSQSGFKLLPPLQKRSVGRQWKNRIKGCLEKGESSRKDVKGKRQVLCKRCGERGHRDTSSKCRYNGTKKRKSRAKQGRPLGSGKATASTSTPKMQKVATNESSVSPGPVTRSQSALSIHGEGATTHELATPPKAVSTSPGSVTRRQLVLSTADGEGESHEIVTRAAKKITPKKGKK